MKVFYSDGSKGILSEIVSKNLYVKNRFTKESWQELENEMKKLDILAFQDPFVFELSGGLITIDYVRTQIATL